MGTSRTMEGVHSKMNGFVSSRQDLASSTWWVPADLLVRQDHEDEDQDDEDEEDDESGEVEDQDDGTDEGYSE
jgi:hypothetical protein